MGIARICLRLIATALAAAVTSQAFAADGGVWSVSKSSGEVWMSSGDIQQASLKPEDHLKPGDTIRTGRNGRILLVRGEESILVAPNSVIGLPTEQKEELSTTIIQRAGSILLEVEKRNVKHFEVETPYLAAVVKGTQFRVSVNGASTKVEVLRGQVEVADFRSGQIAQVMPGQTATALEHGRPGLSLSGSGTFNPIEQGKPRPSSVDRIPVPKVGLSEPRSATNGRSIDASHARLRISSALGEVRLDFHKVTRGLTRSLNAANPGNRTGVNNTVWNSGQSGNASAVVSTADVSNASTGAASVSAAVAAATNAGSTDNNGNGNGNGNSANGNGHGNGGVGNGHGNGNKKH